jgi:hypothetical protein
MHRIRPLLLLALVALTLLSLRETRRVGACTARGGSLDPETGRCDAASFQGEPAQAPLGRRQVVGGAVLVALAGAGVAVWLTRRARRVHAASRS